MVSAWEVFTQLLPLAIPVSYTHLDVYKRQHCFLDGRDTSPTSGKEFIEELEAKIKEIGVCLLYTSNHLLTNCIMQFL